MDLDGVIPINLTHSDCPYTAAGILSATSFSFPVLSYGPCLSFCFCPVTTTTQSWGLILHLNAFLKQLGSVFPPDSRNWYNKLYQALYNDYLLNSKMFFLALVCVTPGDSKVCKVTSPARLGSVGCFSSLQFGCMWTDVLFSKASTHLLARAAHALLSTGALPHWTFEPLRQIKSCSSTKWKPAFGLHEGSVPASAQLPREAKATEKHIVLDD